MEPLKGLARYDPRFLDTPRTARPPNTVLLRIPCLAQRCDRQAEITWRCDECKSALHVSTSHQYIYCDCGRCPCDDWDFQCSNRHNHGPDFVSFDSQELIHVLENTRPLEELNILILGRTGVGKSTWINAFYNYLSYQSLGDAIEAEMLSWIIPFAFRTYSTNDNGDFVDLKVEVGLGNNGDEHGSPSKKVGVQEQDGTTGGSATQATVVHRAHIDNLLIRLIDTPGIGDTRGLSKDKENLADILSVLRTYKKIHGILILLKPNEQRLDLMFKFCIQELLTHLHRDAAKNIVFGFTNTRGTNYAPGDSFDPLRQLLTRFQDVKIPLRKENVYCFDSESFRFLAAQKMHGKTIGYPDENRSSWDYSVAESRRLVDHFRSLPPHDVTSTVNLYETRHRVVALTRPMAAIAEATRSTILVNEDNINDLKQNAKKKEELEKLLTIQVKTLHAKIMDLPRTTCSDPACTSHSPTGLRGIDGNETLKTIYKASCHSPCRLKNVALEQVGAQLIRGCRAMKGQANCQVCGHHWQSHLHVDYVIEESMMETEDPNVKDHLKNNADFHRTKQAAIDAKKRLIAELEEELAQVRAAAAQFSIFLKRNAMIPYNDATLDYIDRCMEEELGKVQAGGSRDKLTSLQRYRDEYREEIKVLEEFIKAGDESRLLDQEGVNILMQDLYQLTHYGDTLRDMNAVINTTHRRAHRETPHIARGKLRTKRQEAPKKVVQAVPDDVGGLALVKVRTPLDNVRTLLRALWGFVR